MQGQSKVSSDCPPIASSKCPTNDCECGGDVAKIVKCIIGTRFVKYKICRDIHIYRVDPQVHCNSNLPRCTCCTSRSSSQSSAFDILIVLSGKHHHVECYCVECKLKVDKKLRRTEIEEIIEKCRNLCIRCKDCHGCGDYTLVIVVRHNVNIERTGISSVKIKEYENEGLKIVRLR